jgi:hypothetical protein
VTVLGKVEFATPGVYFVEILVDDVMKLRYPLPIILVQPPSGAPGEPNNPPPE